MNTILKTEMFICIKRFLRKIAKQRNLYVYIYTHKPCVVSADDSKAQFKWGRVKIQVSYRKDT